MDDEFSNVRNFVFAKVEWTIKYYFAATCREKWVIKSPIFTLNTKSRIKWRLFLKENYVDENHIISAYLSKIKCDSPEVPIWVTWKFFLPCDKRNKFFELESDFENEKSIGIDITHPNELDYMMQRNTEDALIIRSMILVSDKDSQIQKKSKDTGLKSLSQDLTVMYKVGKNYDLNLFIGGFLEKAHKGILCSRNDVLKTAVAREDFITKFPELDIEAAKNVLGYLYSGNLDYVLRKPTFSMLQCIKLLHIKELEDFYEPDVIQMCSVFDVEEQKLYYDIVLPNVLDSDTEISSPCIRNDSSSLEDIVTLHLIPEGRNDCMSIFIKNSKDSFSHISYAELALLDSSGNRKKFRRKRYSASSGLLFKNYITNDILKYFTETGNKNLHFMCSILTPNLSSKISSEVTKELHSNIPIDPEEYYNLLSGQMAALFENGNYGDLTLTCNGEKFHVHSYILTARSYVLRHLYQKNKAMGCKNEWDISCMKSNILKAVLYYMYSGKLLNCNVGDILEIYEAADRFCVLPLKYKCSSILQNNLKHLDLKTVLYLAKKSKDYKLIAALQKSNL